MVTIIGFMWYTLSDLRDSDHGTLAFPFLLPLLITILGRIQLHTFLAIYLFNLFLQAFTTGSVIEQGSTALVNLTAVHAGVVVVLFVSLVANALTRALKNSELVVSDVRINLIVCFDRHITIRKLITLNISLWAFLVLFFFL